MNGILFLLIGLSIHLLEFENALLILVLISIMVVLAARYISVFIPINLLKQQGNKAKVASILSWGGLRGGISLTLAMSLPEDVSNNTILFITYVVVIFSILVQGFKHRQICKTLKQESKNTFIAFTTINGLEYKYLSHDSHLK